MSRTHNYPARQQDGDEIKLPNSRGRWCLGIVDDGEVVGLVEYADETYVNGLRGEGFVRGWVN